MGIKIYYEGWQYECCGDDFRVGDAVRWDATKFDPSLHFVFKDADYAYEAHGGATCAVAGTIARIEAISYEYELLREKNIKVPISFSSEQISSSTDRLADAYLIWLEEATIE